MKQQNIFAYIANTNVLFMDKKRGRKEKGREGEREWGGRGKKEKEGKRKEEKEKHFLFGNSHCCSPFILRNERAYLIIRSLSIELL